MALMRLSVAQRAGVCCVTQSCGWISFPHELSTGFMARREKERGGGQTERERERTIINSINSHSDSFLSQNIINHVCCRTDIRKKKKILVCSGSLVFFLSL